MSQWLIKVETWGAIADATKLYVPTLRNDRARVGLGAIERAILPSQNVTEEHLISQSTARKKETPAQLAVGLIVGFTPYVGGAAMVFATRNIQVLALAGCLITVFCTIAAYLLRKTRDPISAKQRLIIDPFLYAFEYVFTATLIRYVVLRR